MPFPERAKHWLTAGAVGCTAAAVTFSGSPAASAAGGYLSFSSDGLGFSPTVARPIFAENIRLVPGGSTGGSVWVRNDGADAAYLSAGAVSTGMDPDLEGLVSVAASAGSIGGEPAVLGSYGLCSDVYQGWVLEPGDAVRVQLTAGLSPDASNVAMGRTARFDVVFYLQSQDIAGSGPSACEALGILDVTTPPSEPGVPEVAGNSAGIDARDTGRQALAARPGPGTVPGPADTGATAALAGFPAAPGAPGEGEDRNAGFNTNVPPAAAGRLEAASPASFQSTVEPVIRSLSGTLLIALTVAFFAAAGIRLRSRSR